MGNHSFPNKVKLLIFTFTCLVALCLRGYAQLTTMQTIANTGINSYPGTLFQVGNFLYGETIFGGGGFGNIFRVSLGSVPTAPTYLHQFGSDPEGIEPDGGLKLLNGNFYGVVGQGSVIFQMTSAGTISTISKLDGGIDGGCIQGGLSEKGGLLYAAAYCGGVNGNGTVLSVNPVTKIRTIIHRFQGGSDGSQPLNPPIVTRDGSLVGLTARTAYRISESEGFKTFASFPPGWGPIGIAEGKDGNFYVSFTNGGFNGFFGKLTPEGQVTIPPFWSLSDGSYPYASLIEADDGFMYGTLTNNSQNVTKGALIRLDFSGHLETLNTFTGGPWGNLIQASDRNLYGSLFGGSIFKITLVPPRLANISTRLQVGTGDNVMIGGLILKGSQPKKVMLRGIGPSLSNQGVPGAMANPTLELHDSHGTLIASNDNWQTTQVGGVITGSQAAEIQNSGLAPNNPAESAIIASLAPGAYTAIVRGKNNTTGVGLVESYDLNSTADSKLVNISTRGFVKTEDNVMIGGLIIKGTDPGKVIVRAVGPSLTTAGIRNALQDPTLELHDSHGTLIASNDNWQTTQVGGVISGSQAAEIQNSGLAPNNPAESAIIASLAPGAYTAIVRGKNNTTGVGLVEAYQLP